MGRFHCRSQFVLSSDLCQLFMEKSKILSHAVPDRKAVSCDELCASKAFRHLIWIWKCCGLAHRTELYEISVLFPLVLIYSGTEKVLPARLVTDIEILTTHNASSSNVCKIVPRVVKGKSFSCYMSESITSKARKRTTKSEHDRTWHGTIVPSDHIESTSSRASRES